MIRPQISVTQHAIDQALNRFPNIRMERQSLIRMICHEVGRAWEEGRRAKTQPRWLCSDRRKAQAGARYVWTEDHKRAYVVRPARNGERLVVITTLRPPNLGREEIAA
jgi:hypothetical protein